MNEAVSESTDEQLVRIAQDEADTPRGRSAATELLERYRRPVYLWAFRYVRDHERALDMSQDVFLKAWRGLGGFGGKSKFSSWLFAITRNQCLNEVRRVNILADEGTDAELIRDRNPDPARQLEEREGEERVRGLIRSELDPVEQKAIWLRCFERLPVDDITDLLGISESSGARGVLQRARRKLRAALGES